MLVREDTGQEEGGGPGSSPPKSFHSVHSLWSLWQRTEFSNQGKGGGLPGSPVGSWFGETHWPCGGPSLQGETARRILH